MAITQQIIEDMRLDLGLNDDETVFTDDELTRLYERANDVYPTAVYYAFRSLLANAAKRYDYQAAQTNIKAGDVFDHLLLMTRLWKELSDSGANAMRIVGLRSVPTPNPDFPDTLPSYQWRNSLFRRRR